MTGRLASRRLTEERGQSLVLALLVLTVLAIALGSVIFFTSANQRNSAYQKSSQVARSLAEAGVNNGISVLTNAPKDELTSSTLVPSQTNTYPGGSVQWSGTFYPNEQSSECAVAHDNNLTCVGVWKLSGTSTVGNPTGGADIHRTVTAKMQVYRQQDSNTADVWNWIYSPYKSGTSACDTSFTNSVTINVRVWVGGNLCANNTLKINDSLYVGGYLNLGNPQASVGSSSSHVPEVYVGAGCTYSNNPTYDPCVVDGTKVGTKTAKTNVFTDALYTEATGIPSTSELSSVTAPPLCWGITDCPPDSTDPPAGGWYSVASPGPNHPCLNGTTTPTGNALPPVADSDGVFDDINTNDVGSFNLTPDSYSYTCKTSGGELSWDRTKRQLTVQGAVFIDGSATASTSGNTPVTYTGWGNCTAAGVCDGQCNTDGSCQAVLFLSGTFLIQGEHLCAVVNTSGTDCDTSAWDPNKKILIVATDGQGGQLPANQGVNVLTNKSTFQGGLYAKYSIVTGQGGWVQGPLVSGQQTIVVGQSTTLSFPQLTLSPFAINEPPAFMLCNSDVPCQPFDYTG